MRTDKSIFAKTVELLSKAGGGNVGSWSRKASAWFAEQGLPEGIQNLFATHMPKREVWAGAGALFAESGVLRWNETFPEALRNSLLIVGTAPNGDHIAIDLDDGSTGYISHEADWRPRPRAFFLSVSPSIGCYLRDINDSPPRVPDDYWDARARKPNHLP